VLGQIPVVKKMFQSSFLPFSNIW